VFHVLLELHGVFYVLFVDIWSVRCTVWKCIEVQYLYVKWSLLLVDKTLKDYMGVSLDVFVIQAD
jgi:hypothetical protein